MSYLEHFGLSSEPFSNAPVSRFYYDAPQHQQALKRLLYSVSSMKGPSVLVGEIGAGKTTLARRLLDSLPEEEYEAALLVIIHSGIIASWLLRRIALQIGVENPAQEQLALLSQLYQRLLQIYEQGRKAVVLIDEAQMLETRELMEEFRGLLNLEVPERKLISFVFFGLPEIEKNLKLDPPLAQRVAMRYRLEPFTSESTAAYIKHRMRLAGASRNPFTEGAMETLGPLLGPDGYILSLQNGLNERVIARHVGAARTVGAFVHFGADLMELCREAGLNALRRSSSGLLDHLAAFRVTEAMLEVEPRDFDEALGRVRPSAIREAFVTIPDVTWDDVGGLAEAKEQLRNTVERPLRTPQVFRDAGVTPHIGQEAIQMQTIVGLVSAGMGMALVPQSVSNLQRPGVDYRCLSDPVPEIQTSLAWRRDSNSTVLRALLELLATPPTAGPP